MVHGTRRITYEKLYERARRLASALAQRGVKQGDTVAAMLPNVPAMIEAHFGVPMLGAVLNTINTRLDADTVAYILEHGEAKAIITDRAFAAVVGPALKRLKRKLLVIDNDDPLYTGPGERLGEIEYEAFLKQGDPAFAWSPPADESAPIALNYTSGTTGRPKGVVYHHRGTFLETVGNIMAWPLPPRTVYLWTLPLFHCNGWCFGVVGRRDGRDAGLPARGRSGGDLPVDRRARRHPHVRRADRARDAGQRARRAEAQVQAGRSTSRPAARRRRRRSSRAWRSSASASPTSTA